MATFQLGPLILGAVVLLGGWPLRCRGQSVYFEVMNFREPNQCERHQCLSSRLSVCRDHLKGYYLKEKGCLDGMICTLCDYGDTPMDPDVCQCENPPYAVSVGYNQECNIGSTCSEGQCFRPCHTFLHITLCPMDYCQWDTEQLACVSKVVGESMLMWNDVEANTVVEQGQAIVQNTPVSFFPISFAYFKEAAEGYRINGKLVINITSYETMFGLLDTDSDGGLSSGEFAGLPGMLNMLASQTSSRRLTEEEEAEHERRLTPSAALVCGAQGKFLCSFDGACKDDCAECGWKSAHDRAFSTCVVPSPSVCNSDQGKVYCPTNELCMPNTDSPCEGCPGRPYVDFSQFMCLAKWWDEQPLNTWQNWVCRFRNKVGMPCKNDQDCISGLRRCMEDKCQPMAPYDVNNLCQSDDDCPHIGYYCPSDPTNGLNQYWVNYCRKQLGQDEFCLYDRDCQPEFRCNTVELNPQCRRYFSLPIGLPAVVDELCEFGWRDRDGRCAPAAKSKNAGGPCDSNADCITTDATGRTGECVCKAWWQDADSRYCDPVAGDYANHSEKLRNYIWFQVTNCGNHWTEEECLEVMGNEARKLKYDYECEKQGLVGGPFLPPSDCNIPADDSRFKDACAEYQAASR